MSERHHNIFEYYRGPDKDSPLENNVTKALLNTLELCESESVKIRFVQWLINQKAGLELEQDTGNLRIGILEPPTDDEKRDANIKIMLGIKPYWADKFEKSGVKKRARREYDGKIVGQGWLIAIESKLYGGLNEDQFKTLKKQLGGKTKEVIVSWQEIHDFFSSLFSNIPGNRADSLLIEQFTSHLKAIGQVGFQGFEDKHFRFFAQDRLEYGEKEKARKELKDLMNTLGGNLYEYKYRDGKILKELYQGWDWVKGLNKNNRLDSAELKFCLSSRKMTSNQCYLDIQFHKDMPDELAVWACVETRQLLRKLSTKLSKDRDELFRILKKKSLTDYMIELRDNKVMPNGGDIEVRAITKSDLLERGELLRQNADNRGLCFALAKYFKKDEIIKLDGKDQVAKIAEAMEALHPFVKFVNNGK
jgi:hypothetical protein